MNLQMVVYLMSNVLLTFAIERFMKIFFETKRTPIPILILSYSMWFILSSIAFIYLNIPILAIIVNISCIFVISLNYESSMKKKLVATICCFVFLGIVDILVLSFTYLTMPALTVGVEHENMLGFIAIGFISYFLSLLLQNFKSIKRNHFISPMFWIAIVVIPLSSLFLAVVLSLATDLSQGIMVASVVILFIINLLVFNLQDKLSSAYETKLISMLYAQEKDYYLSQCQTMQESVHKVKSLRHDMKIHLSTLRELSARNDLENITLYLNDLLGEAEESEIYSDTGNLAFDSIINYKLKDARKNNILPTINILIPPVTNIKLVDIATILGNLLDNAVCAVEDVDKKWLELDIKFIKGTLVLKAVNPFNGSIKLNDSINNEVRNIVSSKEGENHGYGLKNIKKVVDRYHGEMGINFENNVFTVDILLTTV